MAGRTDKSDVFSIKVQGNSLGARAVRGFAPMIEHVLGLDLLNRRMIYCQQAEKPEDFIKRVFELFRIRWRLTPEEWRRIPRKGPLVVVANHPLGGMEGLVLAAILMKVRPDARVMVNYLLERIPNLRSIFTYVDPFGGASGTAGSLAGMKASIRHLKEGGVLGVFPSGEVSSFDLKTRRVSDPPWNPTIARLIRMTGAPVLPIYFEGRNSLFFQGLGLIHPRLRTMWLAREMIARSGRQIGIRVGSQISNRRLSEIESDAEMIQFLRQRTYLLAHRPVVKTRRKRRRRLIRIPLSIHRRAKETKSHEKIIDAVDQAKMLPEIEQLPTDRCLMSTAEMSVYWAEAYRIPNTLREIGRLREITFRATGEGTGRSIDIDRYDEEYHHLWVWNRKKNEVVAAYRMGRTDELMARRGLDGLYTTSLFRYDEALLRRIYPALELGRSFVRLEYQRGFQPLLLLWRGVCEYCVRHPSYRYLFGPVSISNTYQTVSKALMIEFLKQHHTPPQLAELVEPRNPFKPPRRLRRLKVSAGYGLFETDDLGDLVADLEPDQKGIPVLLRQYLKIGAKLLAFNVDPDFGDCVDGLIVVDLTHPGLAKYMTKEGRAAYMAHHGMPIEPSHKTNTTTPET
jgi:putative hemolysin